jgi:DNA sulfur modification protein DndE
METPPPRWIAQEDSNIDMDWKTFAGDQADILSALVYLSAEKNGEANPETLPAFFRAHLERGINAIQNVRKLSDIAEIKH